MWQTEIKIDSLQRLEISRQTAYELAKNPRFNIYCFDAIYPYHYTTEEITQVAGKVFDKLIPFP